MENKELNYFRDRLIKEKKKFMKTLNNMNNMKEFGPMDIYHSELSNYDNHPADMGTELFMMELDTGIKNKLKDTINEIDNSLVDIKDGNYGICRKCKTLIQEDRLKLIPYSKYCIECANDTLPLKDNFIRTNKFIPIEDEHGTSFSDTNEESVKFDREDTYQKLASYNMVLDDPSFTTGDNQGIMDEQEGDGGDGVEEVENISQEYYDETI